MLSISFRENLSVERSRLLEVIVRVVVPVSTSSTSGVEGVPFVGRVFNRAIEGVRLIVKETTLIGSNVLRTISLIVLHSGSVWAVNRDLVIVSSKSVPVGIRVREESTLKHLVVGGFDTRDHVSGSESSLFNFSEVVLRILVEDKLTDWDQRIVTMGPHLSDIKDIVSIVLSILFRHDLNLKSP